jgi:replicative superfamily II helicase
MNNLGNINFLTWLMNRLIYKHKYRQTDSTIINLNKIIQDLGRPGDSATLMGDEDLDKIISKYYVDFLLDKTEDFHIGYSTEERNKLRSQIKDMVNDIVNNNIPANFIS